MAKADISLRGRAFSIACAPGQEARIQGLSEQLNARVEKIAEAVGNIGDERLLLIAALAMLDELDAARGATHVSPEDAEKTVTSITNVATRIEALVARIEAAQ